jgi:hypothetical protein
MSKSRAMAAVALTRHSLANGISDTKSERTTDQKTPIVMSMSLHTVLLQHAYDMKVGAAE